MQVYKGYKCNITTYFHVCFGENNYEKQEKLRNMDSKGLTNSKLHIENPLWNTHDQVHILVVCEGLK